MRLVPSHTKLASSTLHDRERGQERGRTEFAGGSDGERAVHFPSKLGKRPVGKRAWQDILHLAWLLIAECLLQWLEYQGRQLRDSTQLQDAGVADGSRIHIHLRLQGGGGDGGSTGAESRSCFLEMYSMRKAAKVQSLPHDLHANSPL